MRNRLLLAGLTIFAWLSLKVMDLLLPWPALCVLLCCTLAIMIMHSLWLLMAQQRERRLLAPFTTYQMSAKVKDLWQPSVDIFIPAKNEARVIEKTVRNFFKLDYPDFAVWVIDDVSDDDTPLILQRLQKEYPGLHVVRRMPGSFAGKSAGLNEALPLTKAEVIAVFDADAYVEPDFLNKILPVLSGDSVGAVQAQKKIYLHQKGFLPNCQSCEYALDTYFQASRGLIGGAVELRGNGELIKRSALIDVGGWNNKAITDDLDLTMRLLLAKWDVKFSCDALVWEEAVTTLPGLMRQRRRWAEGSIRRYLDYIFPLNSPFRLSVVERLDILAFISEFAIPALVLLEVLSEIVSFITGGTIHLKFLLAVTLLVLLISVVNFFIAIRLYRSELSVWQALTNTAVVNLYVYAHWVPCVFASFARIIFCQQASKWHRTEHLGGSA